jgi:D-arginine dehydrogenase
LVLAESHSVRRGSFVRPAKLRAESSVAHDYSGTGIRDLHGLHPKRRDSVRRVEMKSYDLLVIGGGMAGVSLAYEMAADRSVCVLEAESTLAFHTTGRSAATFLESYGGPTIRALTTSSRAFLIDPPTPFEQSLMKPLATLLVGTAGQGELIRGFQAEVSALVPSVSLLSSDEARELNPLLRQNYVELALLDQTSMEIDVHSVHQGYLRGLRQRDGAVATSAKVITAEFSQARWTLTDASGRQYRAPTIVNAAGAWVDEVATLFAAQPISIMPLRRTVFMVPAPPSLSIAGLPLTADLDGTFYLKPEGTQFLCSPADEVAQPPGDAKPDEMEIARALEAINTATNLDVRHVRSSWAGLRNFVADRNPVVGFDASVEGLFWYAGQGGYGIQTAPALARTGASLLRGGALPHDVSEKNVSAADLSPTRLTAGPASRPSYSSITP